MRFPRRPNSFDLFVMVFAFSLWAAGAAAGETQSSAGPPAAPVENILSLEAIVNGAKSGTWVFIERAGILYAPRDAFDEWRVQLVPGALGIRFKGWEYWPLSAVPGYKAKIDFARQSVELLFAPEAFSATRLTQDKFKRPPLSPVLPSVFFNYDMNYAASYLTDAPTVDDLSMLNEIGISNENGVLTSTARMDNMTNSQALGNNPPSLTRLETLFTRNFPDKNRTFRAGDTSTRAGMLGFNVYYGGIQFGTNFALTPGYISQPLPALTGTSAAPSTVELYVNDVLRQVSNVPAGPFAIDNFPILTGSGDARLVVRDLLGRETVIEKSFFTSGELLASGLDDWDVEAGKLRLNLGLTSFDYGDAFVSGLWRHGYSNTMTLEGRAEATGETGALEGGIISVLPGQLLGKAALMTSYDRNTGGGVKWLLGLEHQRVRYGASFEAQGASYGFRQLGLDPAAIAPTRLQLAGHLGYYGKKIGTFGFGFATIGRFDDTSITTLSGDYSVQVGKQSSLSLIASQAQAVLNSTFVGFTLTIPLDSNRVVSVYGNTDGSGQNDFYVTASQSPNLQDNNLGWRMLAGQQQSVKRAEGGLYYTGRYGTLTGDISAMPDQTALRLGASGGLILADDHLFATRRVDESFAVAEVPGYGNIGIGLGSNVLTHTDETGLALIPRLMPYMNNQVRIDPKELPVSAELDTIEQYAVPAWRSGVKVTFPVRSGRGALLKIKLDDNEPAPAGATVQIAGDKEEFYVARRGEAFVTGLQETNHLVLTWKDQQCRFDVTLPPGSLDDISRLGPLLCKGVAR